MDFTGAHRETEIQLEVAVTCKLAPHKKTKQTNKHTNTKTTSEWTITNRTDSRRRRLKP